MFDAIVLAGGRGTRMGGVDKPGLTVGRESLVHIAVRATTRARRIVVVGPPRSDLDTAVLQTQETPSGSGPVSALAAGLAALDSDPSDVVVVLAADLPFVDADLVDALVAAVSATSAPATFAVDSDGRVQYLVGVWTSAALSRALDGPTENASMRSIVPADHAVLHLDGTDDCDTVEDLHRARAVVAGRDRDLHVLTPDQARARIRARLQPLPSRRVNPTHARGSVLAEPLVSAEALPAVDISAMDGYAVAGDQPWTVRADVAYAGTTGLPGLTPGDAVRIATGAQVPSGATSVIRDEFVETDETGRLVRSGHAPVQDDTRPRAEDWDVGAALVSAGTLVSPAVMSVALSGEVSELVVRGPVRARVVLSGNEIRSMGALESGQTRDTLGPVLPHYLHALGMDVLDTVQLNDSPTGFSELLTEPIDADVLVVIGATGGGAADQLRTALVRADADIVVGRVLVRPGGSQITAVLPGGSVVLGLPGNPLAAVGTLLLTGPSVVDALTARNRTAPNLGHLVNPEAVQATTFRVVPVTRVATGWHADTAVRTAHLLHLVDHDALAVIPPNVSPGEPVELLPLIQ